MENNNTPDNLTNMEKETMVTYPAYYVESYSEDNKPDESVLVAIDVQIRDNYIEWFDTQSYRKFVSMDTTREEDGSLQFVNPKSGRVYRLSPLSLELYNDKVRDKMYGLDLDFDSEEALWEALLSSFKDA